mmetsp:Transcript_23374/g.61380  ORF Transcript_23374/g.61380 Transcript_23374/m.61380 type:complete len:124 (+) Transcript_23374:603-974(+)
MTVCILPWLDQPVELNKIVSQPCCRGALVRCALEVIFRYRERALSCITRWQFMPLSTCTVNSNCRGSHLCGLQDTGKRLCHRSWYIVDFFLRPPLSAVTTQFSQFSSNIRVLWQFAAGVFSNG